MSEKSSVRKTTGSASESVERKTELIARRMAREHGMPEGFWEGFLPEAYEELFGITRPPAPEEGR